MRKQVYMCFRHDEVFETLVDAKVHEENSGCCATIYVSRKEIEKFRSVIYNPREIARPI